MGDIYRNSDSALNSSQTNIVNNSNNEESLNHLTEKLKEHIPDSTPNRDSVINKNKDDILKRISNSNIVNQNTFKFSTRTLNSTVLDETLNFSNIKNLIKEQLRSELNKEPTEVQIIQRISSIKNTLTTYLNNEIDTYLNSQMSNFSGQIMNIISDNMNIASNLQDFSQVEVLTTGLENALLTSLKSSINNISDSSLPRTLLNSISSTYSSLIDSNKINILSTINANIKGNVRSVTEFATFTISNSILPDRTTTDRKSSTNDISNNLNNKSSSSLSRNSTSSALDSFGKAFGTALLAGAAIKTLSNAFSSMNSRNNNGPNNLGSSNATPPSSSSSVDTTTNGMNDSTGNDRQAQTDQQRQANNPTSNTTQSRNNNPDSSTTPSNNEPPTETYDNSIPPRVPVKNDPRRELQELVLWETDKEKYVLLRDKPGNYILLDEDKNIVRIQHTSGSYIQLSSNIDIEAAGRVNINCSGPSYKKQF